MTIRSGLALVAAAAIAMAGGSAAALSVQTKNAKPAFTVDFSADKDKDKNKGQPPKKNPGHQDKKFQGNQGPGKGGGFNAGDQNKKFQSNQGSKDNGGQKLGGDKKKDGGFKPGAEHKVGNATGKKLRGLSQGRGQTFIRGHNFSTWRGGRYRARYHDRWVTFVPLTALAAILIAGEHYYPYAYISAPADYCEGYTEDGCQMRWREVETIDGDLIGQCVAYCPWED